jgi:transcriptional regulator GlxA family with amidase domain
MATAAPIPQRTARASGASFAIAAAIIAVVVDGLYVAIILSQDPIEWARTIVVAAFILACALCALGGAFGPASSRPVLAAAASGGLVTLGVLGLFSIGLPLLVAGVLAILAWVRVAHGTGARVGFLCAGAFVVAGAALVAGIALT